MTSILNYNNIKKEIAFWLRNSDVFSIATRSVTTDTATGTFASDSTHLINVSNIKNIRSVVVASVTLNYGTDYLYDIDYNDSGTIKTRITFTNAQTGAYTITYDYGVDRIFPDLPKKEISVSDFPRIGMQIIGENSEDNELGGGSEIVDISFSIIVYSPKTEDIDDYIAAIKNQMIQDKKNFYYSVYIKKLSAGPLTKFIDGRDKIWQRNIDYMSMLNEEIA